MPKARMMKFSSDDLMNSKTWSGSETIEFFERVRSAYLNLAAGAPQRFVVIDATQPLEAVIDAAQAALSNMLTRRGEG